MPLRGLSASRVIKPVRWGVLGCARVFQKRMLPAFAASEYNTLTAIASRDANKAASVAAENGKAVALLPMATRFREHKQIPLAPRALEHVALEAHASTPL